MFRKSKPVPPRSEAPLATAVSATPVAAPLEPSYLGPDTAFDGNLVCDGEVHIDCELRGSIQAGTCLVDVHGHVLGSISAQYVMVRGRVIGPITARQLTIAKGGHVEGDVVHEGLSIEQGAYMVGSIMQQSEHVPLPKAAPLENGAEELPALPFKG